MIDFGNNIYTNFAPQPIHHNKSVKLIIIGQCGIGKSRMVNNICKSSQRTGISIGSITHNIFKGQCSLPNKCSLWLVDTPGVEKNSRLTSLTLKRALRCLPWNKIVVMAKFDARFENSTLAELRKISRAFGKEPGRVAFLVSHLDIVDDRPDDVNTKEEVLQSFADSLREKQFEQKVVLFSNNSSDFSKLGEALFACGADQEAKRLEIEDKQFGRALGFPNEEDSQQSTLQSAMQLISQKLTYAKVEQSQRRNAEEWKKTVRIEIEKCVSQFEAEEREGVQTILECYVENWVEQNIPNQQQNIKFKQYQNKIQQLNSQNKVLNTNFINLSRQNKQLRYALKQQQTKLQKNNQQMNNIIKQLQQQHNKQLDKMIAQNNYKYVKERKERQNQKQRQKYRHTQMQLQISRLNQKIRQLEKDRERIRSMREQIYKLNQIIKNMQIEMQRFRQKSAHDQQIIKRLQQQKQKERSFMQQKIRKLEEVSINANISNHNNSKPLINSENYRPNPKQNQNLIYNYTDSKAPAYVKGSSSRNIETAYNGNTQVKENSKQPSNKQTVSKVNRQATPTQDNQITQKKNTNKFISVQSNNLKDANKLNPTNKPQISTKLRTDSKKNNQKLTLTKNIIKSRSPAPLKKDTNCGTNYDYRNNGSPGVPGYIGKKIIIQRIIKPQHQGYVCQFQKYKRHH